MCVVGVQVERWQRWAAPAQEMDTQSDVPVDPCGAGSAQPTAPQPPGSPGWFCPVSPSAHLSLWMLASGHEGLLTLGAAALGLPEQHSKEFPPPPPKKYIWERPGCGGTPGTFLALLPISCCPGPGHSLDNPMGATVQVLES